VKASVPHWYVDGHCHQTDAFFQTPSSELDDVSRLSKHQNANRYTGFTLIVRSALTTARSARVCTPEKFSTLHSDIPRCFSPHHRLHSHHRNSIACVSPPSFYVHHSKKKKELKELPAIHAQKASFKPLFSRTDGKICHLFFFFFCGDPKAGGLQSGVGDGGDGDAGVGGVDAGVGGGDGGKRTRKVPREVPTFFFWTLC
jgi:hypothetical protein